MLNMNITKHIGYRANLKQTDMLCWVNFISHYSTLLIILTKNEETRKQKLNCQHVLLFLKCFNFDTFCTFLLLLSVNLFVKVKPVCCQEYRSLNKFNDLTVTVPVWYTQTERWDLGTLEQWVSSQLQFLFLCKAETHTPITFPQHYRSHLRLQTTHYMTFILFSELNSSCLYANLPLTCKMSFIAIQGTTESLQNDEC